MGLYIGNLPIVRVWQGDTIIRTVTQGNQRFWPEGAGGVLTGSKQLNQCFETGGTRYWSQDESLVGYLGNQGDPYIKLTSLWNSSVNQWIPAIEALVTVSNIAVTDVFATMYAPSSATFGYRIAQDYRTETVFPAVTIDAGTTKDVKILYNLDELGTWNSGPVLGGNHVYPCCFGPTQLSDSIVVSNFSFKATATV